MSWLFIFIICIHMYICVTFWEYCKVLQIQIQKDIYVSFQWLSWLVLFLCIWKVVALFFQNWLSTHDSIYFTYEIQMKGSVSVGKTLNPKLPPMVCGSVLHGSSCRQHVGVFVWMGGLCSVLWLLLMCRIHNINPKTSLLCLLFTWTAALQDKNQF